MDNVQRFRALGLTIPGAIRAALEARGFTVTSFSFKYGISRPLVSRAISGTQAPNEKLVVALIAELGGTHIGWKRLLHEAGRPVEASAAIAGM